ncbi:hypothetical protein [Methylovulum psychrotolerans]|uniref:Uncharacterized protein n=1 Tax=Methylovulum psychrotolerans TaxID=1704499 RepID=A0A2S5CIN9_9GAMM|nr:hypothetical protein [Methylovulum psychrotolerans]POZ50680.1 hypothetical protein AADEFJLK_03577 [Methylovulum psychrotolerans]
MDNNNDNKTDKNRNEAVQHVVVTDITLPFGSLVALMVKMAVAALPAMMILAAATAMLVGLLYHLLVQMLIG